MRRLLYVVLIWLYGVGLLMTILGLLMLAAGTYDEGLAVGNTGAALLLLWIAWFVIDSAIYIFRGRQVGHSI